MLTIILLLFSSARRVIQTRAALQVEIPPLRHQLLVLQRSRHGHRLHLSLADRFEWVWLYMLKTPSNGFPSNVTLLLPVAFLTRTPVPFLHVADFKGVRRGWDLRDTQFAVTRSLDLNYSHTQRAEYFPVELSQSCI